MAPVVDRDTIFNVIPDLFDAFQECDALPVLVTGAQNEEMLAQLREVAGSFETIVVDSPPNGMSRWHFIKAAVKRAAVGDIAAVTNVTGALSYGFDALVAARMAGIRSVARVSGNEIETRRCAGRYRGWRGHMVNWADRFRQHYVFRYSDCVVVMSPKELRRVKAIRGSMSGIVVAPRGISLDRFAQQKHCSSNVLRVLFVGRESLEKGYDIFLNVVKRLANDQRFEFTMVGDYNPRVEGNLAVVGYVDPREMPSVYAQHDVLLSTSRTEGFPQVVVEAMASGLLPVVPRHLFQGNFEEAVTMVSLDDSEIAATLGTIANDPTILAAAKKAARMAAERHFDRVKCSQRYAGAILGEKVTMGDGSV